MQDDDNQDGKTTHERSQSGESAPRHGAHRAGSRHRSSTASSLFERILGDVSTWLENDGVEAAEQRDSSGWRSGTTGSRNPGRQSRRNARDYDYTEDFGDVGGGSVFAQRAQSEKQTEGQAHTQDKFSDHDASHDASHDHSHHDELHRDDDYDDEDGDTSRSQRGRGPKGYRRSDERVAEVVNGVLYDDHIVDASGIEVSVTDGDVRLSGTVGSRRHKHRAENLAARVSGVHDVDNGLRVVRDEGGK